MNIGDIVTIKNCAGMLRVRIEKELSLEEVTKGRGEDKIPDLCRPRLEYHKGTEWGDSLVTLCGNLETRPFNLYLLHITSYYDKPKCYLGGYATTLRKRYLKPCINNQEVSMKNLKIFTENIEQEAIDQINTLMEQPAFSDCKVRIMPDVHAGAGCVIGFTADLGNKVIPNIVGVDIGCGMLTVELGELTFDCGEVVENVTSIDYAKLDRVIRERVPCGHNIHEASSIYRSKNKLEKLQELRCYRELKDTKRFQRSIGTLGGGNHFIEIDEGTDGKKYLVIHTGSRNLGKQVADYYQNLAVELMQGKDELFAKQERLIADYKAQGRRNEIEAAIKELRKSWQARELDIPKDLCYLTGKYREDYLHDMQICQEFAVINRWCIADLILSGMHWVGIDIFETIHNYIEFETNMVRKGAISAKKGEKLLIPINMRDGCIVGVGKGNDDWNQSAPHGAGRIMSRHKAREVVSLDAFKESMDGIYTTSVCADTVDEAPMVYKPMDEIVENIKDTVDILEIIKPVYNFKASEK